MNVSFGRRFLLRRPPDCLGRTKQPPSSSSSSSSSSTTRRCFAALSPGGGSVDSGDNASAKSDDDSSNLDGSSVGAGVSTNDDDRFVRPTMTMTGREDLRKLMGEPLQQPAGNLWGPDIFPHDDDDDEGNDSSMGDDTIQDNNNNNGRKIGKTTYIPAVSLYENEGRARKRILILCTGGTLTMAPDPSQGGSLAPVEGAISRYMAEMNELQSNVDMPDYVLHEYYPFRDSSDLGPADWATVANDIRSNYLHFDGFVVLTGTDTMAYFATALSFMLENLGKPVVFTGSQIPLCEPYNDARRNLIMAMIFAARDSINEVTIFFHDRLLRANRATKVNTHRLLAFDSPNLDPLATIGITIDENDHLVLPPPKGALRVHTRMDTRLLTIRLVPGFDDYMIEQMIASNSDEHRMNALVLELYGTGNIPSAKKSFIQTLADASDKGILVIATTQCFTGNVLLGHYATGRALEQAGVISASDMTLEAVSCKCAYLFGRGDLTPKEVGEIMGISLRGEITPPELLSPPPLSSAYQRAAKKRTRILQISFSAEAAARWATISASNPSKSPPGPPHPTFPSPAAPPGKDAPATT